jgi:hypothetical protein
MLEDKRTKCVSPKTRAKLPIAATKDCAFGKCRFHNLSGETRDKDEDVPESEEEGLQMHVSLIGKLERVALVPADDT